MSAAVSQVPNHRRVRHLRRGESIDTTLLELIQVIAEETDDDREIVAAVLHLLHSGRVRLAGNFRGLRIEAAGDPLTGPA